MSDELVPQNDNEDTAFDAAWERLERATAHAEKHGDTLALVRPQDLRRLLIEFDELEEQAEEACELQDLFEQRCNRAIELWQAAHPGNEDVWPDRTDLVLWLLERLEAKGGEA